MKRENMGAREEGLGEAWMKDLEKAKRMSEKV